MSVISEHYRKFATCSHHSWIHSKAYNDFWARAIVENLTLTHTDRILDLGAGRGELSAAITELLEPVSGIVCVDQSTEMLARSNGMIPVAADALEYLKHAPGGAFSAIIMKQVIHHVPEAERPVLFRELFRVTSANGRVVILTMPETIEYPMISEAAERFRRNQIRHSTIFEGLTMAGFNFRRVPADFPVRIPWNDFADAIRERFISDLHPFSASEIESGLVQLHQTLKSPTELSFNDRLVMFIGMKS